MNAPFQLPTRNLANVLVELQRAHDDLNDAYHELSAGTEQDDVQDRLNESDQRIDNLREEFAKSFQAATGLTWKQIEAAIAEGRL